MAVGGARYGRGGSRFWCGRPGLRTPVTEAIASVDKTNDPGRGDRKTVACWRAS